jgi:uncharacterized protein involved in outer membrane biogenesis
MIRAGKILAVTIILLLLLAGGGVAVLLVWPRPAAEWLASRQLDRRVAIADLAIDWGDPLRLRLRGLQIANMPGGSEDAMVSVDAIDAALDRPALLQGELVYEQLRVERPRILLERDAAGRGNWSFGAAGDAPVPASDSRLVLVPKTRRQFPSLLDFRLTGGELRLRMSSGQWLRLPLDDLAIQAAGEDAPVSIVLDGGYNDSDAQLTATTDSFNALRDATRPFEAGFSIIVAGARLDFRGVIGQPLDFDSVQGRLSLEARRLDDVAGIFASPSGIVAPVKLAGGFSRAGDAWRLDDIAGAVGGSRFEGRIALDEGGRGESDALQVRLDFATLDLASLLPPAQGDWQAQPLRPATAADTPHLDLQIGAATLMHGARRLQQVRLALESAPGRIRLHEASASLAPDSAGAQLRLSGELHAEGADGARLHATLQLEQAEAGMLLQTLGVADARAQLAGAVDARADLSLTGATLGAALQAASGHAVLAMQQGRIARQLVETAAADLRALFRNSRDDSTALRCLLGAAVLRNGTLLLAPLTLRSDGGTIRAAGQIDLAQQQLDMIVRSDPKTTGLLALDIPLYLQGSLGDVSVRPERGAALPMLPVPALPPDQLALAQGNPCWK